jgi:hypothetical protein
VAVFEAKRRRRRRRRRRKREKKIGSAVWRTLWPPRTEW